MCNISLIDYLGYVDSSNRPVGHVEKILSEYGKLLNDFEIKYIVSEPYKAEYMKKVEIIKSQSDIAHKYKNKLSLFFHNVRKILLLIKLILRSKEKKVWFINIDHSIFLALAVIPKFLLKSKDVFITVYKGNFQYRNKIADAIMRRAYKNAQKKIKVAFVSNKNIEMLCNTIFIPDYYYDDKYTKLQSNNKLNRVVCLGVMNNHKKLEELVNLFIKNQFELIIIGHFTDKTRFNNLLKIIDAHKNISIEDKKINNKRYYDLLSTSKYVILPYDMSIYNERTSGILQEAIFLNVVPIAPKELLHYNSIKGISYNCLSDLSLDMQQELKDTIINKNIELRDKFYNYENIKKNIQNSLK